MEISTMRHSLAHILAYAVQELYPCTRFGIGPAIENGFYYDFDFVEADRRRLQRGLTRITPEDLPRIEKKMRELIKNNIDFKKKAVLKKEAKNIFKNQQYKLELIKEIQKEEVQPPEIKRNLGRLNLQKLSIYQCGKFIDLCRGPHIKSTKEISADAFKLTKIAGAYWRGSEKNKMLTRIYGVAFKTKKELNDYLFRQAEAEKRDHRIIGQKLDLFSFDDEVGAGLPLWHPKGALLLQIIQDFWIKEHLASGYELVKTPHIGKINLFRTSGHLDFYRENMYSPIEIEEEKYFLKPMNCPFHLKIYKTKIRSYKNLPVRLAELGTVYRYERSGVLHGLVRVRGFTQDDAHTFCTPNQLAEELIKTLKFGLRLLKIFGFKNYQVYLSTRPKKYIGTPKNWEKATNSLKYALEKVSLKYEIDPGEGVFYGPKIDIKIKDSLDRIWQCTTIQVDFNLPEKFNIFYIDENGRKEQPIMIHRALLGSLERFTGVMLEHYAGALPLWLAPEQIWIIPVGSQHKKYANTVNQQLTAYNLRAKVKDENETVSKKIREGEIQKIPYLLVVGDKEEKAKSIRARTKGNDIGEIKLSKFIKNVIIEQEHKK